MYLVISSKISERESDPMRTSDGVAIALPIPEGESIQEQQQSAGAPFVNRMYAFR